ncbi:MAG: class I mannose-6-phosphate isomerase [Bacteroidia bacterium]|nr:class I mannose-6-phosphate isomerase [Bacteroidia bacterium]
MSIPLYPLTFQTIFKDKIWGGQKIRTILDKDFGGLSNCGETWEISGVEGNVSVVNEGPLAGKSLRELIAEYKGKLVGDRVYEKFGDEFPLLVKFIDANDDLSIQVHPDDELAKQRHNSFGKTEMWYIMQADEGASLITGFNQQLDRAKYQQVFEAGALTSILNREAAVAGDVFFLPAGRVHTIGKGLLLAEIQQTSDITYRIYDFDRVDDAGNKRELHVEEALDAIDYDFYDEYKTQYEQATNKAVDVVESVYFHTQKLSLTEAFDRDYRGQDSFVILVVVEGAGKIVANGVTLPVKAGQALLIPAVLTDVSFVPEGSLTLLEAVVPA